MKLLGLHIEISQSLDWLRSPRIHLSDRQLIVQLTIRAFIGTNVQIRDALEQGNCVSLDAALI